MPLVSQIVEDHKDIHLSPEQRELKRKVKLVALEAVLADRIPGFADPVKLKQ